MYIDRSVCCTLTKRMFKKNMKKKPLYRFSLDKLISTSESSYLNQPAAMLVPAVIHLSHFSLYHFPLPLWKRIIYLRFPFIFVYLVLVLGLQKGLVLTSKIHISWYDWYYMYIDLDCLCGLVVTQTSGSLESKVYFKNWFANTEDKLDML